MLGGHRLTAKVANLVYDVGLHNGEDTDYYLRKGFRVVAFEANPDKIAQAQGRYSAEIAQGQLTIVEGAISEPGAPPRVKFYRNVDHSYWGSTDEAFARRSEVLRTRNDIIEVPAIDFAACVERFGVPYYLKADIVGSETICLRALLDFENKPDYLSIRSEKVAFHRLRQEFELLAQLGYDRFQAVQQSFQHLRAPKNSREGKQIDYQFVEGASGLFGKDLPNKWLTQQQAIAQYHRIFIAYWLFGDYSYLHQTERGARFIKRLESLLRRPLPGWYDTHARHGSVTAHPTNGHGKATHHAAVPAR